MHAMLRNKNTLKRNWCLLMALSLGGFVSPSLQASVAVLSSYEAPSLQAIYNRHWRATSCHPQTRDTRYRFRLCWVGNLGAMVWQMLKCQCWLCGGLTCTLCDPCATYTHSEVRIEFSASEAFVIYFLELLCTFRWLITNGHIMILLRI
jgi:hypothetical protein